ncbi:hypothetical protein [Chamaesiphon sp. OTE_75_metabat_556]|uniref:hypothetical protein n=1 Tax=Chamaesiphon sp. OTE_75_metabat_556 TaxID=2964692 RepID=UPI00286A0901|nr:hypothetical protein [Chamaesiphon sp. OTE_75_metabat_556]
MNLYFIVEGKTERQVYPFWLGYLLPELQRVKNPSQAHTNNYYLISGGGYPSLYEEVEAAVENINISQKYNYLIICTDAEENSVEYMQQEVREYFLENQLNLENTQLKIVIQNRCIETWFLGNSKIYSRQPQSQRLLDYNRYYDVSKECPELMGKYESDVHAHFHEAYLKELFAARNMQYSKTKPRDVQEEYYLQELQSRSQRQANHLPTFQNFIEFCALIRSQLKSI